MKKEKRFILRESDSGVFTACSVVVDRETGVNYLLVKCGYGAGLTVLVDRDGRPIVTPVHSFDEK